MSDEKEEKEAQWKAGLVEAHRANRAILSANKNLAAAIDKYGEVEVFSSPDQLIQAAYMDTLFDPDATPQAKSTAARYLDEFLSISDTSALSKTTGAVLKLRDALQQEISPKKIPGRATHKDKDSGG